MSRRVHTVQSWQRFTDVGVRDKNSLNPINRWSMNLSPFKYPVCHMCLLDAVVASWCLTQQMAGSSPFTGMTNIWGKIFRGNSIDLMEELSNWCMHGKNFLAWFSFLLWKVMQVIQLNLSSPTGFVFVARYNAADWLDGNTNSSGMLKILF